MNMIKYLLVSLALGTPLQASEKEICYQYAEYGKSVAFARDSGISLADVYSTTTDETLRTFAKAIYTNLANIDAYNLYVAFIQKCKENYK